jgi:hypothetical protein
MGYSLLVSALVGEQMCRKLSADPRGLGDGAELAEQVHQAQLALLLNMTRYQPGLHLEC